MSVLKYKDPVTGEWKRADRVKVIGFGDGGDGSASAAEELLKAGEFPEHVHSEVLELANKVNAVRRADSIVFLAMSDTHYPADQTATTAYASNMKSSVQANRAAKALAYMLDLDFFAHLGDVSCGAASTTPEMLKTQIEGFLAYFREARSDLPVFIAIGNHDAGIYYHDAAADGNIHTMAGDYLYRHFTAHSASDDTIFGGEAYGGYCYRDFADKKLRVFLLNTSEKLVGAQKDQATYGAQRLWLANALLDLNSKADAAEWGFILLCHYPADYGGNMPLSELLKAYVEGTSFTVSDPVSSYYVGDGTNEAVDFTGKNGARFIAQFHGHIHNFKTSKLYSYATGSGVQYDAQRICIPNGQFDRENYYSTVGSYTDIDFSEEKSYPKTADSAEGTSFVVNVINPSEEKIYSFCFGAGYDRVIGYAATVYYSISANAQNCTVKGDLSVEAGGSYEAVVTPYDGYKLKTVTVTMGGVDITDAAFVEQEDGGGIISIEAVTGNVIVSVETSKIGEVNYTNLIPLSTAEIGGGEIYNSPYGYKTGYRLNSTSTEVAADNMCCTGFIPLSGTTNVIRIKNVTVEGGALSYLIIYVNTGVSFVSASTDALLNGGSFTASDGTEVLNIVIEDGVIVATVNDASASAVALRLSCGVIDGTSVITVNEEIE